MVCRVPTTDNCEVFLLWLVHFLIHIIINYNIYNKLSFIVMMNGIHILIETFELLRCRTYLEEPVCCLQDIAAFIKKEFDKKYNPTWHCIVGRNFGSYVTHETRHFIYFYLGQVAILLFKSG